MGRHVVAICALLTASACHRPSADVECWGKLDPMVSKVSERRGLELPGVTDLESAGDLVCARTPQGLACVGPSERDIASSKHFVPFTLVDSARAVSSRALHGCAIGNDGTGRCWGFNDEGQLGNGSRNTPDSLSDTYRPVEVRGVKDIAQLAVGTAHTCARLVSGTVDCWGLAEEGQTGISVSTERTEDPGPVLDLGDAIDLATLDDWTCAVRRTGKVVCWGKTDQRVTRTPEEVPGVSGAIQVVVLERLGHQGACALIHDGTVACFDDTKAPPHVLETHDVTQIVAGMVHLCALHRDGTVSCYGGDGAGQLGGADETSHEVPELDHVVQLAAGVSFTCARRAP